MIFIEYNPILLFPRFEKRNNAVLDGENTQSAATRRWFSCISITNRSPTQVRTRVTGQNDTALEKKTLFEWSKIISGKNQFLLPKEENEWHGFGSCHLGFDRLVFWICLE
jgi:hypothetical protein